MRNLFKSCRYFDVTRDPLRKVTKSVSIRYRITSFRRLEQNTIDWRESLIYHYANVSHFGISSEFLWYFNNLAINQECSKIDFVELTMKHTTVRHSEHYKYSMTHAMQSFNLNKLQDNNDSICVSIFLFLLCNTFCSMLQHNHWTKCDDDDARNQYKPILTISGPVQQQTTSKNSSPNKAKILKLPSCYFQWNICSKKLWSVIPVATSRIMKFLKCTTMQKHSCNNINERNMMIQHNWNRVDIFSIQYMPMWNEYKIETRFKYYWGEKVNHQLLLSIDQKQIY